MDTHTHTHTYVCVCVCVCVYIYMLSQSVMSNSCDPMDCSLPGSSVHGDSPLKNTGVCCHALLQGIFPTQGLNPHLLHLLHWQAGSLSCKSSVLRYQVIRCAIILCTTEKKCKYYNGTMTQHFKLKIKF